MKPFVKIGLPLLLLVAIGVAFIGSRMVQSRPGVEQALLLAPVAARSFDVKVHTVGVLDAAESQVVSSTVRGEKGKIIWLVDEGTRVRKNDVVVRLDPTPFEEKVHRLSGELKTLEAAAEATRQLLELEKNQVEREILSAEYDLKVAQLELRKIIAGEGPIQTAQYREEVENAREAHARYQAYIEELESLSSGMQIPLSELELARERAEELKEKLENAKAKSANYEENVLPSQVEANRAKAKKAEMLIDRTRKAGVYKIAKAVSTLNEAQEKRNNADIALARARSELEKTTIRAPISGIAILHEAFRDGVKRKPRVGDKVWQNQPLLYLPDIATMIVETQVREIDLHRIGLEKPCTITIDAYPDTAFTGRVILIGILATERVERGAGEKYFQVTVAMNDSDPRLRPGMTARVTVFSERCRNVPAVPLQAVFSEDGHYYCYRHSPRGFKKKRIELGCSNENWAEVRSGLQAGDKVSLVRPALETLAG